MENVRLVGAKLKTALVLLALSPVAAFAQSGDTYDTSGATGWIAAGVTAALVIIPAWMGLVYLIRASKQVRKS